MCRACGFGSEEVGVGIKVGLVGLGQFGSAFVSLFAGHPLVDKLVLCDTRSARVAEMLSGHGLGEW